MGTETGWWYDFYSPLGCSDSLKHFNQDGDSGEHTGYLHEQISESGDPHTVDTVEM